MTDEIAKLEPTEEIFTEEQKKLIQELMVTIDLDIFVILEVELSLLEQNKQREDFKHKVKSVSDKCGITDEELDAVAHSIKELIELRVLSIEPCEATTIMEKQTKIVKLGIATETTEKLQG